MHHLPRKKIKLFSLILLLPLVGWGQKTTKQKFQPEYDAKTLHFGYFIGLATTHYKLTYDQSFFSPVDNKEYAAITSPSTLAIKMGGLMNFYVNDRFDLRIAPTVAIYNKQFRLQLINPTPVTTSAAAISITDTIPKSLDKAWFEIPIILKYKSIRRGNFRMYAFGGTRIGFETNTLNRNSALSIRTFGTKSTDLALEYGAGMELFQRFFKFTPELSFSHGVVNLLERGNVGGGPLSLLSNIRSNTVTFTIFFE